MESIGDLAKYKAQELKEREKTIQLMGFDPMVERGFTQVPNLVLTNKELSIGAKITYAMLLKYSWDNDYCFPGQQTLADDIGSTDRSVRKWLKELNASGFITITQRGQGKVNIYKLWAQVKKKR